MKKLAAIFLGFTIIALSAIYGCSDRSPTETSNTDPIYNDTGAVITITDRTGKVWDITYAVNAYGMESRRFNFGNGPFSFIPYNNPQFFTDGQTGYPSPSATTQIIGLDYNGETRAYPISAFISHEVINDKVGDQYIAVTY